MIFMDKQEKHIYNFKGCEDLNSLIADGRSYVVSQCENCEINNNPKRQKQYFQFPFDVLAIMKLNIVSFFTELHISYTQTTHKSNPTINFHGYPSFPFINQLSKDIYSKWNRESLRLTCNLNADPKTSPIDWPNKPVNKLTPQNITNLPSSSGCPVI